MIFSVHLPVFRMLQFDPAGHAGGKAVSVIVRQLILLIRTDEPALPEEQIHVQVMMNILMSVVAGTVCQQYCRKFALVAADDGQQQF